MIRQWTDEDRRLRPELYDRLVIRLVRRNRWTTAERTGWPVGALETCEHLDAEHPGWTVHWQPANTLTGWEHPAGYVARRESSGYVCGVDPAALVTAMRRAPVARHWHYFARCCDRIPAVRHCRSETG